MRTNVSYARQAYIMNGLAASGIPAGGPITIFPVVYMALSSAKADASDTWATFSPMSAPSGLADGLVTNVAYTPAANPSDPPTTVYTLTRVVTNNSNQVVTIKKIGLHDNPVNGPATNLWFSTPLLDSQGLPVTIPPNATLTITDTVTMLP